MSTPVAMSRRARTLGLGVAYGLSTLIPVSRLPRTATSLAVGGLAGAVALAAGLRAFTDQPPTGTGGEAPGEAPGGASEGRSPGPSRGRRARAAVGVVGTVVGVVGVSTWVGLAVDAVIESALARRGVRRPRVVMAVGAAVLGAALEWADGASQDEPAGPAAPGSPGRAGVAPVA